MINGVRIPSGSKTLDTIERTVRSIEYVVKVTLVVGCAKIVWLVLSYMMPGTPFTVVGKVEFTCLRDDFSRVVVSLASFAVTNEWAMSSKYKLSCNSLEQY